MFPALESALLGIRQNLRTLDRAAADIANVNATGYRAARAPDRAGPTQFTASPLDLSIQGAGWFRVAAHDGSSFGEVLYTRAGDFHRDGQGFVATADGRYLIGYALDSTGRPTAGEVRIRIPDDAVSVSVGEDGAVTSTSATGERTALAAVSLAAFPNPGRLAPAGGSLYRATAASGAAVAGTPGASGFGRLAAGTLEGSGTDLAESVVDSLLARHGVEASIWAAQGADATYEALFRLGRR